MSVCVGMYSVCDSTARHMFYCTDFVSRHRTHATDVSSTNVSHKCIVVLVAERIWSIM